MKKIILLTSTILLSIGAWASPSCEKLASIATTNASNYGDEKTVAPIKGKKGTRAYFHNAPSNQCRTPLFVIPKDQVEVLQDIISNGETWAYVVFIGGETQTLTQGWIKKKYLGEMSYF